MFEDAAVYSEHHNLQRRDAKKLVKFTVSKMDWRKQTEDVVMDIGCGTGESFRDLLLPNFPDVKKIIAIDVLPSMIAFAKKNSAHPKINYHVSDISDMSTLKSWRAEISKAISVYCLHWVNKQRTAFENVYRLLKPSGEAVFLFTLSCRLWSIYECLVANPKWTNFLKGVDLYVPDSHFKSYGALHYRNMLRDIGFDIILCEDENREFIFRTDEECKGSLVSIMPFANHIPKQLREEFKEDVLQTYLKYYGRTQYGKCSLGYKALVVHIRKPAQ